MYANAACRVAPSQEQLECLNATMNDQLSEVTSTCALLDIVDVRK